MFHEAVCLCKSQLSEPNWEGLPDGVWRLLDGVCANWYEGAGSDSSIPLWLIVFPALPDHRKWVAGSRQQTHRCIQGLHWAWWACLCSHPSSPFPSPLYVERTGFPSIWVGVTIEYKPETRGGQKKSQSSSPLSVADCLSGSNPTQLTGSKTSFPPTSSPL